MLTVDECKKIISKIGLRLGVSPKLITTRLLDEEDKVNMMTASFEIVELEAAVKVWRDNGMPDYVTRKTEPIEPNIR